MYKSINKAHKAPAKPKPQMSRHAAALRLRTIRDQNVRHHKAHTDRLKLAEGVMQKTARNSYELEYNRLLGAAQFNRLTPFAIGRLQDLKSLLNKT